MVRDVWRGRGWGERDGWRRMREEKERKRKKKNRRL